MGKLIHAQSDAAVNDSKLLSAHSRYYFDQLFIESIYLQSFNHLSQKQRVKTNTHNGHIEREIHGSMHAARVAWSTIMLHRLCKKQYQTQYHH